MWYLIALVVGLAAGGIVVFGMLESRFAASEKQRKLNQKAAEDAAQFGAANAARAGELDSRESYLAARYATYESKFVRYEELQNENQMFKRDLRNVDIELRKSKLDGEQSRKARELIDEKVEAVGRKYLKDSLKWIDSALNQNNYIQCKQRLTEVIQNCREIGLSISKADESQYFGELKSEFERVVRAALEREEQARIKAQIREEQQVKQELDAELRRLEREQNALQAALQKALAETHDQHSAEVERLKAKLAEAEEKSRRAISQAQLTKAGHVYVISNVGAFGDQVFKIGMTRRLEPGDRVQELGDASVPFPFDVHMMISATDAPALENALHRAFHKHRINKVNLRKEFFRVGIEDIRRIVRDHHGEVEYVADAAALEYRQSITMTDEDQEFIADLFDDAEDDAAEANAAR